MNNTRLKIAKLAGSTDTARIGRALESVDRVKSVKIVPEANEALVDHEGADEREMTSAIKRQGYIAVIE